MQKESMVVVETDVGKLTWQPANSCCELLTREFADEEITAMRLSGFAELKEVIRGALPLLISKTLEVEHKIKEHIRIANENAHAIETARRRGFLLETQKTD